MKLLAVPPFAAIVFGVAIPIAGPAQAEPPMVDKVTFEISGAEARFDVTLSHPDTGWDHYADGWRIETPDGVVLGTRVLAHPHVSEQPFTRSLSGVELPVGVAQIVVRAKCSVDGWSAAGTEVTLK